MIKIITSHSKQVFISLCALLLLIECKKDNPDNKDLFTHYLLSADRYDKLNVEIQYMAGFKPTTQTLDNLKAFLEQRLNKPGGITFVQTAIAAQSKTSYSFSDIEAIEKVNKTVAGNTTTLTVYFLFLDGDYSESTSSSKVLGIAYGQSSMAIFEKTIKQFSGGIGKPSVANLETSVIEHEFGHTMGLVNSGTAMQTAHMDADHGAHCSNKDCLMYYSSESSDIIGSMIGGNIPVLDAACLNDLKANGGK